MDIGQRLTRTKTTGRTASQSIIRYSSFTSAHIWQLWCTTYYSRQLGASQGPKPSAIPKQERQNAASTVSWRVLTTMQVRLSEGCIECTTYTARAGMSSFSHTRDTRGFKKSKVCHLTPTPYDLLLQFWLGPSTVDMHCMYWAHSWQNFPQLPLPLAVVNQDRLTQFMFIGPPRGFITNMILIRSAVFAQWRRAEPRDRLTGIHCDHQLTITCILCIQCSLKIIIPSEIATELWRELNYQIIILRVCVLVCTI